MADYKKMYTILFNAITDVIHSLQDAQSETEEVYVSAKEFLLRLVTETDEKSDD